MLSFSLMTSIFHSKFSCFPDLVLAWYFIFVRPSPPPTKASERNDSHQGSMVEMMQRFMKQSSGSSLTCSNPNQTSRAMYHFYKHNMMTFKGSMTSLPICSLGFL